MATLDLQTTSRRASELDPRQVIRDPQGGSLRTLVCAENDGGVIVTLRFTDGSTSKVNADLPVDVVVT